MSIPGGACLAGDVGATKTNLALFTEESGVREPLYERTLPSGNFETLEDLVKEFLGGTDVRPRRAAFGVAGPVVEGQAYITNLPWRMSEARLAEQLELDQVALVNDLVAIAKSVPVLGGDDLRTLNAGEPVETGPIAVVAPGTGLGEAYLVWHRDGYHAYPSEGGHADFAPLDAEQMELLAYMQPKVGHVSYEYVCSGTGMAYLFRFLRDTGRVQAPPEVDRAVSEADQPTRAIFERAFETEKPAEICVETVRLFARILAAEAGNMALKVLSLGGVYLGGGLPPRMLPVLQEPFFMERFREKGRFERIVSKFPVHVMMNSKAALYGAAEVCKSG
ncbi:MAG: glucokinase [Spirochaetaceae bacterium]